MREDSRLRRLRIEREKLINLAARSEFIKVEEIDVQPGWPPEKYVVTFTCRGISGIEKSGEPKSSDFHQVSIYLSRDFPRQEPYLKWLTPIWHPNIEHEEPYHVCTNNVQNWFATKSLDDLVLVLGEMVQYKRYHAVWKDPWPLDRAAASWVVEYAEPKGILGPHKPYDDRLLLREYEIKLFGGGNGAQQTPKPVTQQPRKTAKLVLGVKKSTNDLKTQPPPETPLARKKGVTLGAPAKYVVCPECGQENRLRQADGTKREFYCGQCRTPITADSNEKHEGAHP